MENLTVELVNGPKGPKLRMRNIPDAEQLDWLIAELGRTRALIEPPVPEDLPPGHAVAVRVQQLGPAEIGTELDGSLVLLIRDARFGWLGYRLSQPIRQWLLSALDSDAQSTQGSEPQH